MRVIKCAQRVLRTLCTREYNLDIRGCGLAAGDGVDAVSVVVHMYTRTISEVEGKVQQVDLEVG